MKITDSSKLAVSCLFEGNHLESYYEDGSILAWKDQHVVYLSQQGIRNTLNLDLALKNQELKRKMEQLIQNLNQYSDSEKYYVMNLNQLILKEQTEYEDKHVKMTQFDWCTPEIEETEKGFKIMSDQKGANLTLHFDLYMVQVEYYQLIGRVSTDYSEKTNHTKHLLQKYNYEYTQLPIKEQKQSFPTYRYKKVNKKYSIFNIPSQWQYPLSLIWISLLQYKIIAHQFCYLEFQNPKNRTMMPEVVELAKITKTSGQKLNIPLLGKPNHQDKCKVIKINGKQDKRYYLCEVWYCSEIALMHDSFGFWFVQGSTVHYKKKNKVQIDYKCHINALPLVLRMGNQTERSVKSQLDLFMAYFQHNSRTSTNSLPEAKFDNEANLLNEEYVDEIGSFKAYSNGCVIAKFVDKCLMTLNSKKMEIKVIDGRGDSLVIGVHNQQSYNFQKYKEYIKWVLEFQEKNFYQEEWARKKQLSMQLDSMMGANEIFLKTFDLYK